MRCIAYVSRAHINDYGISRPKGLSEIVTSSCRFNPLYDVTGIISYRRGQYFQVLEGPDHKINSLLLKISIDSRHKDMWVFLDMPITKRCFDHWGVSVFDYVDQKPFFEEFIRSNHNIINGFTNEQRERVKDFIKIEESKDELNNDYNGKLLRLKAWPDLNNISQPQAVIGLCIKLTKKPYPFDKLVNDSELGSYEQLVKTIKYFETLSILSISEQVPKIQADILEKQSIEPVKPNKFYGAIKRFLGIG